MYAEPFFTADTTQGCVVHCGQAQFLDCFRCENCARSSRIYEGSYWEEFRCGMRVIVENRRPNFNFNSWSVLFEILWILTG